jgi:hypothetical protein
MLCPDPATISPKVAVRCDSVAKLGSTEASSESSASPQSRLPPRSGDEKMSAGSIAALSVSLLVVFALLAAGIFYYQRRWGSKRRDGAYLPYAETTAPVQEDGGPRQQATLNLEQV